MLRVATLSALAVAAAKEHLCVPWTRAQRSALERSNAFLPEPATFAAEAPRDADADALHALLRSLGEACADPFLPVGGTNALGSHLNALVLPLRYAVAANRTMLTPPLGAYANGSCASLACYFLPTAPRCERALGYPAPHAGAAAARPRPPAAAAAALKRARRKRANACGGAAAPECGDYDAIEALGEADIPRAWRSGAARGACGGDAQGRKRERSDTCAVPTLRASAMKRDRAPAPRGVEDRGDFWYVAQLLAHLARPNAASRARLARAAAAAGVRRAPRPLLGVHVRRGDSCRAAQEASKARRCSPFGEYWYHALAIGAGKGCKTS
ncbi:hypothetical protein AURANDRAFT_64162 [Aureococcus anophagefferens]|uniref:Uncharacterized protein n=1 Tax=Aureococcus anophagefferens TaxID=44056 RepID=F0Y967_AURAN|nr:hypothetical protein AURANDRAFT_64162 [Aureococcus anophagefferens]EGB08185.1 hypothetical protein AURANDRAFT_64162 [Aureococcus anophagefferens]|eukprot:XP_009036920.1 hypothetical protein AURANDRAFT_64162 [Aureococcus anophagefferens]